MCGHPLRVTSYVDDQSSLLDTVFLNNDNNSPVKTSKDAFSAIERRYLTYALYRDIV